jgi:anti-sigma B factor antagonist
MSTSVKARKCEGATVLELEGVLVYGKETLHQRVRQLIEQNESRIVLNLAGITYVDSSGLGEIVAAFSAAKKAGGSLKLASATPLLRDIIRITKTQKFLELYETEEEALASFSS